MSKSKKDEFDCAFSWPDKEAHVVGTHYGIVVVYEIFGNTTRMIFVYRGRAYGKNFDKIYSYPWEVRLARQFATEMAAQVDLKATNA